MQPMTPQDIVNDSRKKIEVNLKEDPIAHKHCVTAVPDVIEPKLSDIMKSERVSGLLILATKEDMREFREDPTTMPLVLMYMGEVLVSNDMTPVSLRISFVLQDFGDVFP